MGPYLLRHLIDVTVSTPHPAHAWNMVMQPLLLYLFIALGANYSSYMCMSYLRATTYGSGLMHCIRRQLHWYTLQHSYTFFQNDFAGRLASKIMDASGEIRNLVNISRRLLWAISSFVVAGITLGLVQPWLLIPFFLWSLMNFFVLRHMIPMIRRLAFYYADTKSLCVGRMVDAYTNIQTVKLFANDELENESVVEAMHEARNRNFKLLWGNFKLDWTTLCLESFLITSLLLTTIWLWTQGLTTPGTIAMVIPLSMLMVQQANMFREELAGMLEALGTVEDAIMTLIHPFQVKDAVHALPLKVSRGQIHFREIKFQYNPTAPKVIKGLSLHIPAGQKVGLVGPSGAGKSTLVNLLLRFYDVSSGSITIDAQDIREVTQESLRAQIGMVTQDSSLLHRSILDNIAYGKPGANMAEVVAAAGKAQAHEFILGLQDKDGNQGYEARVGERGVKLSGGQRQRIAIARLILKNAPILILDEATSALDSEVEQAIQSNLSTLMEGKTVIAIAHRLSTISQLDRLIVLHEGEVVEDGSHAELLKAKGLYAKLWALQSGGFLAEDLE
jgi:ATP-binding cassette subfamily B multidrug efflux pump